MTQRLNLISTWLGDRGSGKTWFFRKHVEPLIRTKILVLDTLDHDKYRNHPQLGPAYTIGRASDIKRWTAGKMRIIANDHTQTFEEIHKYLFNCTVVCEDAKKYCGRTGQLDPSIFKLCIDSKQRNVDIIFMFQTWKASYTDLYQIGDNLLIFKSKSPKIRLDQFDDPEEVLAVWKRVKDHPNPHYCEKINL